MRTDVHVTHSTIPPLVSAPPAPVSDDLAVSREALNEGIKAAQAGDRQRARTALMRAAELDPKCETAWLWLASISEYPEELMVFLENVLAIDAQNRRALGWRAATQSLLAKTYVQRGIDAAEAEQPNYAEDCFRKALEYDSENTIALLWLASLSSVDERRVEYLEHVLRIDPENSAAIGALKQRQKEWSEAKLDEAKRAAFEGDVNTALELLATLTSDSPDCVDAWLLRAHLVSKPDEKLAALKRVLEISPDNNAARVSYESLSSLFATPEVTPSSANIEGPVIEVSDDDAGSIEPEIVRPDDVALFDVSQSVSDSWVDANLKTETYDPTEFVYDLEPDAVTPEVVDEESIPMPDAEFALAPDAPTGFETTIESIVDEPVPTGKVILVVDDSATVRKLIASKLENAGHEVVTCGDGFAALDVIREITPDLVLLDVAMPGMDGYQTCRQIRGWMATANVPIVMISGKDEVIDETGGRLAGMSAYITKPFGPETLMKAVEQYLGAAAAAERVPVG